MFLINLTYKQPIETVNAYLVDHIKFLNKHYETGDFIVSGRKHPRVGGIILCRCESKEDVLAIIKEDPFYIEEIADYECIEFEPTKYAEAFKVFVTKSKQ